MNNSIKKVYKVFLCWIICLTLILATFSISTVTTFAAEKKFTANAMAPLFINDWNRFQGDLALAKQLGIDAISVDVWWGDVEKDGDNQFNWSYYDNVFSKIKAAGLKVVPIMSFHQCGGSVGDDYTSYLPSWIWTKYNGATLPSYNRVYSLTSDQSYSITSDASFSITLNQAYTLTSNDLKYKSALGNYSSEYIELWVDELVANEYIDFMNAFESRYGMLYAKDIQEINISAGPSGELRYPSYSAHDPNSGYPTKGVMQCYSRPAQEDFRKCMFEKYGSIQNINTAWGSNLTSVSQITPPTDGDLFYKSGTLNPYYQTQYGKDLLGWYNNALVQHGRNMINYGQTAFDESFANIPLGIKIPGVHWQMESDTPRAAEVNAGLVNADFSPQNGYGYKPILEMINDFNGKVVLHFTCLEMNDYSGNATSAPKKLVGYVGDAAAALGVELKGENALAGGNDERYFWDNIDHAISVHGYNGITILRLNDAVNGASYNYYSQLINKYKTVEKAAVNFTVENITTSLGEEVYVVGDVTQLGNWSPSLAVKMNNLGNNKWTATVPGFNLNSTIKFKFIKKAGSNVNWESINDRAYTITSQVNDYVGSWNNETIISDKIAVNFAVQNAYTEMGENIYIVGSIPELGNWNPVSAIKLDPSNYPTWTKSIPNLPTNTSFQFKFIKKAANGSVTWESRGNRIYTTSTTNGEYSGIWNQ